MRWSAWLVVAGCGASTPRPAPAPALDEPSSPAPPATTAEATILADRGCIAAGTYAVLVDLSGAEVVMTGASGRDVCVELASHVAAHQRLTIVWDAAEPHVEWNGPQRTIVADACALRLESAAGDVSIAFRNHKGHGVANLALGGSCAARDVKIELTPEP